MRKKVFEYKCGKCGRVVKSRARDEMRCVYCGYTILYKPRVKVVKRVKAR